MRKAIKPGARAIDATMGNGHDTLWLCELVGDTGVVYGFDVQPGALKNTRSRLAEAGLIERARLFQLGHEHVAER